jgi:polar amino acid transport system permease protein
VKTEDGEGGVVGSFNRVRDRYEALSSRISYRAKLAAVWVVIATGLSAMFIALGLDVPFMREWAPYILKGGFLTLFISAGGILLAIPLALLGALGRLSKNPIPYGIAGFYTSFFRGTPLIVQIFFIYTALPQLASLGPPWMDRLLILDINLAGIIALGFNYGAYMTEIFRAGIQSVSHGQVEAAHALAMTPTQTMRRVVFPQAVRVIIPPTGNEFIAMLKDSALVGVAGTQELFYRASRVGRFNFRTLETLLIAAAVYWLLTSIFSFFQKRLEERFSRGYVREGPVDTLPQHGAHSG